MGIERNHVKQDCFTPAPRLPYELRLLDFEAAMQDVYDFFFDVNSYLGEKGLPRLEDTLRRANLSGTLSDMLTASIAKHSRSLAQNQHHNGHPDLLVGGVYPNDAVKAGERGVEIKSTGKPGGAVDTHGGRDQWLCVFVYDIDRTTEPAVDRAPLTFREVYLSQVKVDDFRRNDRGPLGTRTSTIGGDALARFREGWVYLDRLAPARSRRDASGARKQTHPPPP